MTTCWETPPSSLSLIVTKSNGNRAVCSNVASVFYSYIYRGSFWTRQMPAADFPSFIPTLLSIIKFSDWPLYPTICPLSLHVSLPNSTHGYLLYLKPKSIHYKNQRASPVHCSTVCQCFIPLLAPTSYLESDDETACTWYHTCWAENLIHGSFLSSDHTYLAAPQPKCIHQYSRLYPTYSCIKKPTYLPGDQGHKFYLRFHYFKNYG
jgi:hypothetical protein